MRHGGSDTQIKWQVAVKHVKQAARHGKSMLREAQPLAMGSQAKRIHLVVGRFLDAPGEWHLFGSLCKMRSLKLQQSFLNTCWQ